MQWSKRSKTNSKICKSKKIYWGEYMELWDAYDESFNKLDCAPLIRGQVIPNGVFHLVCEALVRHTDGTYLIMQRDFHKHLGGMWEATAGGSALQGEQPIDRRNRNNSFFDKTSGYSGTQATSFNILRIYLYYRNKQKCNKITGRGNHCL